MLCGNNKAIFGEHIIIKSTVLCTYKDIFLTCCVVVAMYMLDFKTPGPGYTEFITQRPSECYEFHRSWF